MHPFSRPLGRTAVASFAVLAACAGANKGAPAGIDPNPTEDPDLSPGQKLSAPTPRPSSREPSAQDTAPFDALPPGPESDGPAAPTASTDANKGAPAPTAKAVLDCMTISKDLVRTNDVSKCDQGPPKLYCDGRVLALLAVKPNVPLLLGMGPDQKNPLPADLDVVRFYDRVLTAAEIAAHAKKMYEPCKAGSGCAVELDFDAQAGDGFKDTGPSGVPTKTNGEIKTIPGVQGNAAHFDGKGWVEIPHHAALTFTKAFSFSAWIRPSASCPATAEKIPCEFMRIFDKSDALRLDRHAGGLRFQNTAWWFHGPGLENSKGIWVHLAITFDHERGVVYYKDGRESKSCRI